jgi:RND family efflux transporter MFP subunit
MKSRKLHFIPLLLLIGLVTAFQSCADKQKQEKTNKNKPVSVITALPVTTQTFVFEVSGRIEAIQRAGISTKVMGYISNINVKVGDQVAKGQLLATIESHDIQAKKAQADAMVSEAEAALTNATKDYERFTQLYKQQSATTKEFDNINLQYSSAKARVEAARQMRNEAVAMLSYTSLRAPFSGIVTEKTADAGSMATPGMPILTIEQTGGFQVSAIIPETEIGGIQQGQAVVVTVKSTAKTFNARVTELSTSSLSSGGQYLVRINVPENLTKGLFAGQYANVQFHRNLASTITSEQLVLVPMSGIVRKDQLTGIYTISHNNTALLRWVRLGKNYGNNVEVLSGLAPGEKFIAQADEKLWNGVAVKENNIGKL